MHTLIDLWRASTRTEGDILLTQLNDYVRTAEAVKIFGVAQKTLSKWVASRATPMHRNLENYY